jgi:ubiquinone/menaquinone biosynthesis C-methylase UbiE
MAKQHNRSPAGWDPIAAWYDGWMGEAGSDHHRKLAIPTVLDLLLPSPGEQILDIGAGQGVLAPYITERRAAYTGIDISPKLLSIARRRHGKKGRFLHGDARYLPAMRELAAGAFDGIVFLLSIQDMNPLDDVLQSAAWALRSGGRLVILMTHPCFRIPRQSGWEYDRERHLQFRRIDRYLTPLPVPMKSHDQGATISFHRPLSEYVNGLVSCGLLIDHLREVVTYKTGTTRAEKRAHAEIPLFLGLRARKV